MPVNDNENIETLELQKMDYVASAAKAALGVVPFAGSLLVELAGTVIPNQRINRNGGRSCRMCIANAISARMSPISMPCQD